jgi:hypothetical protein
MSFGKLAFERAGEVRMTGRTVYLIVSLILLSTPQSLAQQDGQTDAKPVRFCLKGSEEADKQVCFTGRAEGDAEGPTSGPAFEAQQQALQDELQRRAAAARAAQKR